MHNGLSTKADRLLTIVQATYEEEESDKGSVKRKREVSKSYHIFKQTNECRAEPGGGEDHHLHGGPL